MRRRTTCTIEYPPIRLGAPSMAPITPGTAPGENRSRLLELSATRFASQGYAQVSLRDLAAQLGVSTGAIYSNFRNKADLLAEVLGTRVLEDMERSQRSRADLWLPEVVRESFLRLPERAQMRSLLLEAGTAARTDGELRDRLRPTLKALIDQWIEDYRAWQRFGHVDPDVDMAAVVTILWSVELGIGVLEAQDAVQVEPEVLAAIVGDFLESLVQEPRDAPVPTRRPPPDSKQMAEAAPPGPIGLADESATRERLIDAAIELFAERGYAASTVRDLARSTGMTTGSIYGNFANKAVLLAAAIEARLDRDPRVFPRFDGRTRIVHRPHRISLRPIRPAGAVTGAADRRCCRRPVGRGCPRPTSSRRAPARGALGVRVHEPARNPRPGGRRGDPALCLSHVECGARARTARGIRPAGPRFSNDHHGVSPVVPPVRPGTARQPDGTDGDGWQALPSVSGLTKARGARRWVQNTAGRVAPTSI